VSAKSQKDANFLNLSEYCYQVASTKCSGYKRTHFVMVRGLLEFLTNLVASREHSCLLTATAFTGILADMPRKGGIIITAVWIKKVFTKASARFLIE
jgi:hypothetical protein